MKREKKIRGINSDTQKWVIGYGVIDCEDISQIIHKQGINIMQHTNVLPETVGEFTGLTDKNGVEIYEGDILKYISEGFEDENMNGRVFLKTVDFYNGCFVAYSTNPKYSDEPTYLFCCVHYEIIGNIYETPELLCPLKP